MTDNLRPVVVKIIENFKSRLDASVRKQISNVQYSDLGMMIDEAIAEKSVQPQTWLKKWPGSCVRAPAKQNLNYNAGNGLFRHMASFNLMLILVNTATTEACFTLV